MTRTLRSALVTLGDPRKLTGGYLYHRRLAELASRHAARLDFVSVPERPFPLAIGNGGAVLRRAAQSGADVIVIDSIAAAFVGPWLRRRPPGLPVVAMLHQPPGGIDSGPVRTGLQAVLDRLTYRQTRLLMVASESLAEDLRRAGEPAERITVVPPGRDVAAAASTAPGDLRRGRQAALLCVGNWVERKGILRLLEAVAALDDDVATLHLAGSTDTDPPYGRRVRARLAQPDLAGRVAVHGPVSVAEVAALYAAADAFVLPSLKEPYGTVYGEAMACGLPVIGWRAGNLPYLAEHEREGLLIEPGNVRGLTAALRRIAIDPGLRARLGAAARQRAFGRPTWEDVAALFFGRLRDVVETIQARAPAYLA